MSEEAKQIRAKQYDPGGSYVTEDQLQGILEMNGKLQPSTHHTFDMVYEIRALRAELAAAQAENARLRTTLDWALPPLQWALHHSVFTDYDIRNRARHAVDEALVAKASPAEPERSAREVGRS